MLSIESTLQGIWQEILAAGSIGVDEDFFDRGGNSLSALRILTSVRKTFGISMPLESIYHLNTVKAMAAKIASEEAQP
ncbi:acyl carrier protein [Xenorhabdus bovienii]|uniref:acyl carrier protein n=1 Tax=Xenorhabdus bovienii TaxID=40576 RepID=UPI00215827E9|nr:phosphopantetheine-binding protein [Xenorhabdus bovienii]